MCAVCDKIDFLYDTLIALCPDDEIRKVMIEAMDDARGKEVINKAEHRQLIGNVFCHLFSVFLLREGISMQDIFPVLMDHYADEVRTSQGNGHERSVMRQRMKEYES